MKFSKLKRLIASLLLICMITPMFQISTSAASNSLVPTYLNLMKGRGITDIDTIQSFTLDDLRVISLYLSNFYVPYFTTMDGDSNTKQEHIDFMVKSLADIGVNKEAAEQLVQNAFDASLNSAEKLYVRIEDLKMLANRGGKNAVSEYGSGIGWGIGVGRYLDTWQIDDGIKDFFLGGLEGDDTYVKGATELLKSYMGDRSKYTTSIGNSGRKRMIVPFITDATLKSDTYLSAVGGSADSEYTPLTLYLFNSIMADLSFVQLDGKRTNDYINVYRGSGSSISDIEVLRIDNEFISLYTAVIDQLPDGSGTNGTAVFNFPLTSTDNIETLSNDEIRSTMSPLQCLYVDWVGNVICDFGSERTVVVPSCINNKVWLKLNDSSSKSRLNMVSSWAVGVLGTGKYFSYENGNNIVTRNSKDSDGNILYELTTVYEAGYWKESRGNRSLFNSMSVDSDNPTELATIIIDCNLAIQPAGGVGVTWGQGETLETIPHGSFFSTVVKRSNPLSEMLWWDDTKASSIDQSNYLTSNFLKYNLYDLSNVNTLFLSTGNFKSKGTSLGQILGYSSADKEFIRSMLLTYTYAYDNRGVEGSSDYTLSGVASGISDAVSGFGSLVENILKSLEVTSKSGAEALLTELEAQIGDGEPTTEQSNTKMALETYIASSEDPTEETDSTSSTVGNQLIDMKFNDIFPSITGDINWSAVSNADTLALEVLGFVYYFLHPVEGAQYVANWAKNKLSGIMVKFHEDMVGSTDSNLSTGMTQYLGFSGYATVPNLNDLEWTAWALDRYNSMIIYLITLIAIIIVSYVIIGMMTIQRGIIGIVCFSFLAFIPPFAINGAVDLSNTASSAIYSKKFNYWAYSQMQGYVSSLDSMAEIKDVNNYIDYLIADSAATSGGTLTSGSAKGKTSLGGTPQTGYSGVKLKWQSPKRMFESAQLKNELNTSLTSTNYSSSYLSFLTNSQSNNLQVQEFLDSETAMYLYRDYMDIYRYAATSYNLYRTASNQISNYSGQGSVNNLYGISDGSGNNVGQSWTSRSNGLNDTEKGIKYSSGELYSNYVMANLETSSTAKGLSEDLKATSSLNHMRKGFILPTLGSMVGNVDYYSLDTLGVSYLLRFNQAVIDTNKEFNKFKTALTNDSLQINKNSLPVFGLTFDKFEYGLSEFLDLRDSSLSSYDSELNSKFGYYYYSLYSESPFYYFNYNTRDQLRKWSQGYNYNAKSLTSSTENFKDLFLNNNQDYFFNLYDYAGDGYGELRDFMNMHDLFYYVIPTLQNGVDFVDAFDEMFGMFTYSDCSLSIDSAGQILYNGKSHKTVQELIDYVRSTSDTLTDEDIYKLWHDLNVQMIFNCYTTWLDIMNDCDYSKPETISVAGEKFVVFNPVDPTSYYEMDDLGNIIKGRYMVFSRSEMVYRGLKESELTAVEKKIIKIQDNVYSQSLDLMNYYSLADEVLIQAYSMLQLFEFNKEFSQTSALSHSYNLYPQGYELKAFTYDSYLRLIVAEASGEPISSQNTSIYTRVIGKTSVIFGIAMLVNDVVAVYLIPALRMFFIIVIFFLSIALLIALAIQLKLHIFESLWKSILSPLLAFVIVSIGLSWIVSLFISNGSTLVTSSSVTISMGDPTMVMIVMLVLNVTVLVLYWKICKKCVLDLVNYSKTIFVNASNAIVGAVSAVRDTALGGNAVRRASRLAGFTGGLAWGMTGGFVGNKIADAEARRQYGKAELKADKMRAKRDKKVNKMVAKKEEIQGYKANGDNALMRHLKASGAGHVVETGMNKYDAIAQKNRAKRGK